MKALRSLHIGLGLSALVLAVSLSLPPQADFIYVSSLNAYRHSSEASFRTRGLDPIPIAEGLLCFQGPTETALEVLGSDPKWTGDHGYRIQKPQIKNPNLLQADLYETKSGSKKAIPIFRCGQSFQAFLVTRIIQLKKERTELNAILQKAHQEFAEFNLKER